MRVRVATASSVPCVGASTYETRAAAVYAPLVHCSGKRLRRRLASNSPAGTCDRGEIVARSW